MIEKYLYSATMWAVTVASMDATGWMTVGWLRGETDAISLTVMAATCIAAFATTVYVSAMEL